MPLETNSRLFPDFSPKKGCSNPLNLIYCIPVLGMEFPP